MTTPTVGPLEILDKDTACFSGRDDADAFHQALARTLEDYAAACVRADAALRRFKTRYTTDIVVARYTSLYAELIADKSRRNES